MPGGSQIALEYCLLTDQVDIYTYIHFDRELLPNCATANLDNDETNV